MTAGRVASGLMALVFAFAAAVQWNDPDPVPWMLAYLAVTVLALLHAAASRAYASASLLVGIALLGGSFAQAGSVLRADASAYTSWEMTSATAEEARESLGLLIGALYALCLAWAARRRTRVAASATSARTPTE